MKTLNIMKRLAGKYCVQICLDNCNPHNDGLAFDNLYEAIMYVNQLTFAACKNEMNHTDNDVRGHSYTVSIYMHEDPFGENCSREDGYYPMMHSVTIFA